MGAPVQTRIPVLTLETTLTAKEFGEPAGPMTYNDKYDGEEGHAEGAAVGVVKAQTFLPRHRPFSSESGTIKHPCNMCSSAGVSGVNVLQNGLPACGRHAHHMPYKRYLMSFIYHIMVRCASTNLGFLYGHDSRNEKALA